MRSVTTGPQNAQWLPFGNDSDDNPDDNPAISRSHKHDPSTCNGHDFPLFAPGGGGGRGVSGFRFRCNVSPAIMQMPALKWTDCSLQSAFKWPQHAPRFLGIICKNIKENPEIEYFMRCQELCISAPFAAVIIANELRKKVIERWF